MRDFFVTWSRTAARELVTISNWIAQFNPPAAGRWLDATELQVSSLKNFPERCSLAPEAKDVGVDVRQLIVGKKRGRYRVLFRVKGNEIQVLRIIHGMREPLTPEEIAESGWEKTN